MNGPPPRLGRRGAVGALLGAGLMVFAGCGHVPALPSAGFLAGQPVDTSVDHPLAQRYLATGELPADLARVLDRHRRNGTTPSRAELQAISSAWSPDVATIVFAEAIHAQRDSDDLRQEFLAVAERTDGQVPLTAAQARTLDPRLKVLFAPGWFYKANGHITGGDFALQRRVLSGLGVANELIDTAENGAVGRNADVVADAIRQAVADGHRILLVSASKSGAEVAQALGRRLAPSEAEHVAAWISFGGVIRGTPVADTLLQSAACFVAEAHLALKGHDMEGLASMATARQRPQFEALGLPPDLLSIAYVPVPLSGHITERGKLPYRLLRRHGPNDGLTLLSDELIPGGITLIEPGADHYLDRPDRAERALALFTVVARRAGLLPGPALAASPSQGRGPAPGHRTGPPSHPPP